MAAYLSRTRGLLRSITTTRRGFREVGADWARDEWCSAADLSTAGLTSSSGKPISCAAISIWLSREVVRPWAAEIALSISGESKRVRLRLHSAGCLCLSTMLLFSTLRRANVEGIKLCAAQLV